MVGASRQSRLLIPALMFVTVIPVKNYAWTLILPILFGCAGRPSVNRDETKAALHLQIGSAHLLNGNYPKALSELLEAEKLSPDNPLILNNLGLAFLVRNKFDDAENRFRHALKSNPKYTDARNNLGRMYIDIGLYDKAIRELEIAASDLTYENPEKSWANLGQAYFFKKDYEKAKAALQRSLQERHESCFTMSYYGRALYELENYKSAAESLDQAALLCESLLFEEPSFYGALSFYKLGDLDRARVRFEEFVQKHPKSRYNAKAKEMLEILK